LHIISPDIVMLFLIWHSRTS